MDFLCTNKFYVVSVGPAQKMNKMINTKRWKKGKQNN